MNKSLAGHGDYDVEMGKNSLRMVAWIFIWTISAVLADKAELYGWYTADWMPLAAIIVTTALGAGMIFGYVRFLKALDDLQKKIQFDALAIALGVSLVGSFTYSLLVTSGYIKDAEISDIMVLMMVTYSIATIVGVVRYR